MGLLSTVPAWAECPSDLGWKASLIQQSSQWDEFDARGARLVHEHANLPGWELATNLRCAAWEFSAAWQQLAGNRAYDGQTSDGVLLQSQSDWSQQHMRFDSRTQYELIQVHKSSAGAFVCQDCYVVSGIYSDRVNII
jgi:hypothetical protein